MKSFNFWDFLSLESSHLLISFHLELSPWLHTQICLISLNLKASLQLFSFVHFLMQSLPNYSQISWIIFSFSSIKDFVGFSSWFFPQISPEHFADFPRKCVSPTSSCCAIFSHWCLLAAEVIQAHRGRRSWSCENVSVCGLDFHVFRGHCAVSDPIGAGRRCDMLRDSADAAPERCDLDKRFRRCRWREDAEHEGVSGGDISDWASEEERGHAALYTSWGLLNGEL